MDNSQCLLHVENLSVSYEAVEAVKNISFSVLPGEIFGLLGPNGAGKTSTLSAIEGLVSFSSGTIIVDGYDVIKDPLHARDL